MHSVVCSPSDESNSTINMSNDARPLIRKVSRFQVHTVQESPFSVELPSNTQHDLVSTAMSVDIPTSTAFSSPTDEKSSQYQQQTATVVCEIPTTNDLEVMLNQVLPKTPNMETTAPNFINTNSSQGSIQQATTPTSSLQLEHSVSPSTTSDTQEQMIENQHATHGISIQHPSHTQIQGEVATGTNSYSKKMFIYWFIYVIKIVLSCSWNTIFIDGWH